MRELSARGGISWLSAGFPPVGYLLLWIGRIAGIPDSAQALIRGATISRRFRSAGPRLRIGRNVIINGWSTISLGYDVTLNDGVFLSSDGELSIGSGTHLDVYTSVYGHGGVRIGEKCAIAAGVRIYSQSNSHAMGSSVDIIDQPRIYKQVTIGDDVWIGANAVILPGVTIHSHSVIGAGAVVTKDIEASSVAAGVPARVIRKR